MNARKWAFACAMAVILVGTCAFARQADGTLGLIQVPNDGFPAVVIAGGAFEVITAEPAELSILDAAGNVVPGLTSEGGRCTVAPGTPSGTYAIQAVAAGDKKDVTRRSVFVVDPPPEYYLVAHVTDVHIGNIERARPAYDVFKDMVAAANDSGISLILITGDLTDNGAPEQFRQFLDVLDTCKIPSFVCPGNHDRTGLNYESFFGPTWYMFQFGNDAYQAVDTKDFVMADDLGPQDADLEVWRRATRSSRWSIGFSHRYDFQMGMRAQLTLFVDDPLDAFVFGHYHGRKPETMGKTAPWSPTELIMTPAAVDGFYRILDITPNGVKAREPQRIPEPQPGPQPAPETAPAPASDQLVAK